jgi:hypothetical protein
MTTPRETFEPIQVLMPEKDELGGTEMVEVSADEGRVYLSIDGTFLTDGEIAMPPAVADAVIDALCKARDYQRGMG